MVVASKDTDRSLAWGWQVMQTDILNLVKDITGKDDFNEALEVVLIDYIEQKLHIHREKVVQLESKYGMGFKEFEQKLGRELALSWEHERDYMEWDWALAEIAALQELQQKVRQYGG
jgi:hypothetical protein